MNTRQVLIPDPVSACIFNAQQRLYTISSQQLHYSRTTIPIAEQRLKVDSTASPPHEGSPVFNRRSAIGTDISVFAVGRGESRWLCPHERGHEGIDNGFLPTRTQIRRCPSRLRSGD